jgi:hypothetical protein
LTRLRTNLVLGRIENPAGLDVDDVLLTSAILAALPVVAAPDFMVAVLGYDGNPLDPETAPEIVYITAHANGAPTATIQRAREGTAARAHPWHEKWLHGPVVSEFPVVARVATGAVAAGDVVEIAVPWPVAFADASYTPTVSLLQGDAIAASTLQIRRIRTQTAAQITVIVENTDLVAAHAGVLNAIAIHD